MTDRQAQIVTKFAVGINFSELRLYQPGTLEQSTRERNTIYNGTVVDLVAFFKLRTPQELLIWIEDDGLERYTLLYRVRLLPTSSRINLMELLGGPLRISSVSLLGVTLLTAARRDPTYDEITFLGYAEESGHPLPLNPVGDEDAPTYFLDAFPGGSIFALEQVYADSPGPFYTTRDGAVNLVIGTQYYALPGDGKVFLDTDSLIGEYEFTNLSSSSSINVSASRLVIGVLSVSSMFGNVSDRLQVWIDDSRIFQVNADDTLEIYAPRTDGNEGGVNAGAIPGDDQSFCFATLVSETNVKCWVDGVQVIDQTTPEVVDVEGDLKVYMRGGSWKFLGTWSDDDIPDDHLACINAVVAHYT